MIYRKLFFPQLFEQHSRFENSCRSQFFVTVVQILCFLSLMKSSIEAIFHAMCCICVRRCVGIETHAHIYAHVKIYIYICVWSGELTFSYLDLRTYFRHLFVLWKECSICNNKTFNSYCISLAVWWGRFALSGKTMWKMVECSNYLRKRSPTFSWSLLCASECYLIKVFYVCRFSVAVLGM